MKFLFALSVFVVVGGYEIKKLNQIPGTVQQIEFDSYLNSYIKSTDSLYRLDDQNNITLQYEFTDFWKIIINKQNDAYFFDNGTVHRVWRLKSGSNATDYLFHFQDSSTPYHDIYFIDSSDYIYIDSGDGVIFFRPNQNIPLIIRNLEGFRFDKYDEDEEGNVYLISSQAQKNSIAVITRDAKKSSVPTATFLPNINTKISDYRNWHNTSFIIEYPTTTIASVNISSDKADDTILLQYRVNYYFFNSTNDRFFILENSKLPDISRLHFVTPEKDLINVEGNLTSSIGNHGGMSAFDRQGTAHFAYSNGGIRQVLSLRFDETILRGIDVPSKTDIYDLEVDRDDNLWILADDLYLLEKGKEALEKISNAEFVTTINSFLKIKKETNEIYISTDSGLFLCSKV